MSIRRATPSDLAACVRIACDGFVGDDTPDAAWFLEELAKPGAALVVESPGPGILRGFMLTLKDDHGIIVRLIATGSQFRRQGVGKALLTRVKAPAGAWVRIENEASRAMFAAMGYELGVPKWSEADKPTRHTGDWCYMVLAKRKK